MKEIGRPAFGSYPTCSPEAMSQSWRRASSVSATLCSGIRGLIKRIVLMPGARRGEMEAVLHGDLAAILEWTGNGHGKTKTDTPMTGMSVSVVAGAGFEPATFRL